jgi:hypothetical protein
MYEGINHSPLHEDILLQDKKLVVCKHEIVIKVEAAVMEEDDEGEMLGTKEICKNTYRIPVPSNKDYHIFMKAFFDHLQNSMTKSYEQANQNS